MERLSSTPRPDWQQAVEARGLKWHSGSTPYWSEDAYYRFTTDEIDAVERATNELHERCLEAVQHVIDEGRYPELKIPEHAIPLIERSWKEEPPSIYGRFDLAYDGKSPPVMLEYNADTPTSLLEASVIQWDWLEALHKGADQFNSIHERLVGLWREMIPYLRSGGATRAARALLVDGRHRGRDDDSLSRGDGGAGGCPRRAGCRWRTSVGIRMRREFVDMSNHRIDTLFKLYPWEWIVHEPFAQFLPKAKTQFIEPAWKMILSNKGILAVLWDLFPGHPNLLPAYLDEPNGMFEYVKKPLLSREGANVTVHTMKEHLESTGEYGAEGYVFQQLAPIPTFDGKRPILGSWVIGQEAGGMGVREADGWVTGNTSRFVPHLFR